MLKVERTMIGSRGKEKKLELEYFRSRASVLAMEFLLGSLGQTRPSCSVCSVCSARIDSSGGDRGSA